MSLGWQTESTLLKFKAKPIKVDDKSLLPLKAIISSSKNQQSSSSSSSSSILRSKRGANTSSHNNFIEIFQKSKGEKKKQKLDNNNNNNNNIHIHEANKNTASILKAKSELYDQLKRGNIPNSGESFLINFEEKKKLEDKYKFDNNNNDNSSNNNNNNNNKQFNSIDNNDKIEIIDEFGRSKFLLKSSEEYKDYILSKDIKKRKDFIMDKHNEYNYEYKTDNDLIYQPNSEWSWSKGNQKDNDISNASDYIEKIALQKGYHSILKEKIDNELIINENNQSNLTSNASQIKSQWERTFDTDTKILLSDIHNETSERRAEFSKTILKTTKIETNNNNNIISSSGSITSSTDERRELLRLKKENRKKI